MKLPPALDFDVADRQAIGAQLLKRLDAIRAYSGVVWSERQQAWIVTDHEAVAEALKGALPLSSGRFEKLLRFIPESEQWRIDRVRRIFPTFVVNQDPPQHTRLRKLLMKAFGREVSERYRPFVQETIASVFAEAAERNDVEFVEEIARRVPGSLILNLLGLDQSHYPSLMRWTQSISVALGGGAPTLDMLDNVERTFGEMEDLFSAEIRRRQAVPCGDFISSLIAAREGEDSLSFDELLGVCFLTLSAGNNSTTNTLALGTVALARDPEARDYLLQHPEGMSDALMEIMRFVAMSTNQVRLVKADFEWRGRHLRRGELVNLFVAAANHDPSMFKNPEALDLARPQTGNMTFAPGLHFCIGHLLARMQLEEFYPRLFRQFPGLEILDQDLQWSTALNFRGLKALNVRLAPA